MGRRLFLPCRAIQHSALPRIRCTPPCGLAKCRFSHDKAARVHSTDLLETLTPALPSAVHLSEGHALLSVAVAEQPMRNTGMVLRWLNPAWTPLWVKVRHGVHLRRVNEVHAAPQAQRKQCTSPGARIERLEDLDR